MKKGNKTDRRNHNGRPPDAVIDQRIAEMVIILAKRPTAHRCQLHKEFCPRWGVTWKQVDVIIGRARAEMLGRLQRSKETFRCESLAFYEAQLSDPKASVRDKTLARHRIDDLLGLDAPKRQELSGPDGGPVALDIPEPGKIVIYLPEKDSLEESVKAET